MTTTITMSPDEYEELLEKQNEPSKVLQDSYNNVKAKLDEAYKTIDELNASLATYVIGGMKPRDLGSNVREVRKPRWDSYDLDVIHNAANKSIGAEVLACQLDRSEQSVKSKAASLGYKIKHNYIWSK